MAPAVSVSTGCVPVTMCTVAKIRQWARGLKPRNLHWKLFDKTKAARRPENLTFSTSCRERGGRRRDEDRSSCGRLQQLPPSWWQPRISNRSPHPLLPDPGSTGPPLPSLGPPLEIKPRYSAFRQRKKVRRAVFGSRSQPPSLLGICDLIPLRGSCRGGSIFGILKQRQTAVCPAAWTRRSFAACLKQSRRLMGHERCRAV